MFVRKMLDYLLKSQYHPSVLTRQSRVKAAAPPVTTFSAPLMHFSIQKNFPSNQNFPLKKYLGGNWDF